MARSTPPLTWFRAFEAAARRLSFTAAAEELGLTQSAVSQQVRALEQRLGAALFLRKARGIALTDDGRRLLPQVAAALQTLAAATHAFDAGPARDLLTIATSVSVAQHILAPRIADFRAAHSGLRIRILSAIWPDDFAAPIADVEIRFGSEPQVGAGAQRLTPDRLIAVAARPLETPLHEQPLIEAVGTAERWSHWAEATAYAAPLEPQLHVDSYGMALDLARHGAGVALVSSLLAASALQGGAAALAHEASILGRDGYFLAQRKETAAAAAFAAWLREAVAGPPLR
ncbi:MAG: LysR family transcriptional regulator [Pseudomonadota bacterium]